MKHNDTTTGLKLTLNIDATKEEAADICGSVGGSLVINSMFSKYGIPGTVSCSTVAFFPLEIHFLPLNRNELNKPNKN